MQTHKLSLVIMKTHSNRDAMRWAKGLKRRLRRVGNSEANIHVVDKKDFNERWIPASLLGRSQPVVDDIKDLNRELELLHAYESNLSKELQRLRNSVDDKDFGGDLLYDSEEEDSSESNLDSDSDDGPSDSELKRPLSFVKLRTSGTVLTQAEGTEWVLNGLGVFYKF